jgi:hypothetical protein
MMADKDKVAVDLLKHHTDGGTKYPPGFRLMLQPQMAEWLIEQGVAKAASGGASKSITMPRRSSRGPGCCGGGW